jgi:hypothetical protein
MLVSYSKTEGLIQGAKDTFSGEKPCELCCKIAAARKGDVGKEETPLPLPSLGKLLQDFVLLDLPSVLPPRADEYHLPPFPGISPSDCVLATAPALPPPRSFA